MEIKYIPINFTNGIADRVPTVTQWDRGQFLKITGLPLPDAAEFHFKNSDNGELLLVAGTTEDGITTVPIPNSMLCEPFNITVFIYVSDTDSGKTVYRIDINMQPRGKAEDIPTDPDDPHYINGLSELIDKAADTVAESRELLSKTRDACEDAVLAAAAAQAISDTLTPADAHFDPESWTAQSGLAVAEAIESIQPIDENTEFIFDGGNAYGAVSTDILVDGTLSVTSENAIANKAVTSAVNALKDSIEKAKTEILLSVYPVGSVYIGTADINPALLFGGRWERIKDKFLLACGDTYSAGDEGGEATHTLIVEEMPSHNHSITYRDTYSTIDVQRIAVSAGDTDIVTTDIVTNETGGNGAHNNMPPYLAVYVWKRKS